MHSIRAADFFMKGYNCAQSVFMAFSDLTGINIDDAAKISSGFGGGMGGVREVCGAFSGLVLVYNHIYGYTNAADSQEKSRVYGDIQVLADSFKTKTGNLICREILKGGIDISDMSEEEQLYCRNKPCAKLVITAAKLLDEYISKNSIIQ